MSSTPFERPFVLPAADPGRRLVPAGVILAVGLALVSLASLPDGVRRGLLLWAVLCLLGMFLELRRGRDRPIARWRPASGWWIEGPGGIEPAAVHPATRVFGHRIVLYLRPASGGTRRYDLSSRQLSPAALRRLRVLLRLGRG